MLQNISFWSLAGLSRPRPSSANGEIQGCLICRYGRKGLCRDLTITRAQRLGPALHSLLDTMPGQRLAEPSPRYRHDWES